MITKGLLAASAAAAMLGATVIVTAVRAHADEQFWALSPTRLLTELLASRRNNPKSPAPGRRPSAPAPITADLAAKS
jgi:hypothetical protein